MGATSDENSRSSRARERLNAARPRWNGRRLPTQLLRWPPIWLAAGIGFSGATITMTQSPRWSASYYVGLGLVLSAAYGWLHMLVREALGLFRTLEAEHKLDQLLPEPEVVAEPDDATEPVPFEDTTAGLFAATPDEPVNLSPFAEPEPASEPVAAETQFPEPSTSGVQR